MISKEKIIIDTFQEIINKHAFGLHELSKDRNRVNATVCRLIAEEMDKQIEGEMRYGPVLREWMFILSKSGIKFKTPLKNTIKVAAVRIDNNKLRAILLIDETLKELKIKSGRSIQVLRKCTF